MSAMQTPKTYRDVLDAEGWAYVSRIAQRVPPDLNPTLYPTNEGLIHALGSHGAVDALIGLQEATRVYFSNIVFAALRIALVRPPEPRPPREPAMTDQIWNEMFDVPWEASE